MSADSWLDRVNLSMAKLPGVSPVNVMMMAGNQPFSELKIPSIKTDHVQICPQTSGVFNEDSAAVLMSLFSETKFRLHANVRVFREAIISDFSSMDRHPAYWQQLAKISRMLDGRGYSAHAGKRSESTLTEAFDAVRRAQDSFDCVVGIEGMYPSKGDQYLLSTWGEYAALLESGIPFALDMSHLFILATTCRWYEQTLVQEMLSSESCMEIHLSGNDGTMDRHHQLDHQPLWWGDMDYANPQALIFTEGMQRAL